MFPGSVPGPARLGLEKLEVAGNLVYDFRKKQSVFVFMIRELFNDGAPIEGKLREFVISVGICWVSYWVFMAAYWFRIAN